MSRTSKIAAARKRSLALVIIVLVVAFMVAMRAIAAHASAAEAMERQPVKIMIGAKEAGNSLPAANVGMTADEWIKTVKKPDHQVVWNE